MRGTSVAIGAGSLSHMLTDLRYGFRSLCRTPTFMAASILILALGIGANTSVFSVVDAVLLRPLPYANPGRLFDLESAGANQVGLFNVAEFRTYRDQSRSFQGLAAVASINTTWVDHGEAKLVQGLRVSADVFNLLGVSPASGRLLAPADDRPDAAKVVVISNALWHDVYGGSPDVIGRMIAMGGESRTIVGVLPPEFLLPVNSFHADVCVPFQSESDPTRNDTSALHYLRVVARLKPDVTPAQALADTGAVLADLRRNHPDDFPGVEQNRLVPLTDQVVGDSRGVLLTLLGVVASLLLLACANLAGLLLVRGLGRQRELAIRAALGSSRFRLVRLLLAESLILAVLGGVAGLVLAHWSLGVLLTLIPAGVPRGHEIQFNGAILLFTAGVSLLAGLIPAVAPLWLCSRMDLREAVSSGGRGNTAAGSQMRLRHLLVSIQIALALALLVCTGLFLRSFWAADSQRPGLDPAHILTARLTLPAAGYPDRASLIRYYEQVRTRIDSIPGIEHAGTTSLLPLGAGLATAEFNVVGQPVKPGTDRPSANYRLITPGYLDTMGIPLRDGRAFSETDDLHHPLAVIVNATLARTMFPDGPALGKQLSINDDATGDRVFEIVGIVGDVQEQKIDAAPSFEVYIPFRQMSVVAVPWIRLRSWWVLRSSLAAQTLENEVRRAVVSVDPGVPVVSVWTMEQVADSALAVRRFTLIVIGFLAGAALLLTATGVYATIAYGVAQRTREIGVRLALGATAPQVFRLIVGEGIALAVVGAVLGTVTAYGLSQLIASQLYGVGPHDPVALTASIVLLLGTAALACSIPARRAAQVDPIVAMRTE